MLKRSILLFAAFACHSPAMAADYVVLIQSGVNIRIAPDTSSVIVGQASKGELHHYVGETDGWFKIRMFSGEERFISKALTAKLSEEQILPGHNLDHAIPHEIRRAMRLRILRAGERAAREAEEIIPAALDEGRHLRYRKILEDRYIQRIFIDYRIQPALFESLAAESG